MLEASPVWVAGPAGVAAVVGGPVLALGGREARGRGRRAARGAPEVHAVWVSCSIVLKMSFCYHLVTSLSILCLT